MGVRKKSPCIKLHLTRDLGHMTCDTLHETYGGGVNILLKLQLPSWMNEWRSDCRTASATPGLLIIYFSFVFVLKGEHCCHAVFKFIVPFTSLAPASICITAEYQIPSLQWPIGWQGAGLQCMVDKAWSTVHGTQHSAHSTVYTVQCTVHYAQRTVHTAQHTAVHSAYSTVHTAQCS